MAKPDNYAIQNCDHNDITFLNLQEYWDNVSQNYVIGLRKVLRARTKQEYTQAWLKTGICKQTLFSAIKTLGVPNIFTMDIMHLSVLNDPDILLDLWWATIKTYQSDNISTWDWAVLRNPKLWKAHGKTIVLSVLYIPSSFGQAPGNPAEKINSGYKAWEFQLYTYLWVGADTFSPHSF